MIMTEANNNIRSESWLSFTYWRVAKISTKVEYAWVWKLLARPNEETYWGNIRRFLKCSSLGGGGGEAGVHVPSVLFPFTPSYCI